MADKAASYRYNPLHQDIICHETAIDELARMVDDSRLRAGDDHLRPDHPAGVQRGAESSGGAG